MNKVCIVYKFLILFFVFIAIQNCNYAYVTYDYPDGYYGYNSNRGENYLQITQIEKSLFNRTYERESIYNRLDRIERKLFRTTNQRDSLADRLEAICQNINPSLMANVPLSELRKMEQRILRQTFTSDDIDNRIGRLEQAVLGMTQSGNLDTRFQRLKIATTQNHSPQYYHSYNNYQPSYVYPASNSTAKNILNSVVNGIGTITGFTPPVYNPDFNSGWPNNNWTQRGEFWNNNRYYNQAHGGNSGAMVRILD